MKTIGMTDGNADGYIDPINKYAYRQFWSDVELFRAQKNLSRSEPIPPFTSDEMRYAFLKMCFTTLLFTVIETENELNKSEEPAKVIENINSLDGVERTLTSEEIVRLQKLFDSFSKDNSLSEKLQIIPVSVEIENEELNQYIRTEKMKLKRYFIGRYILNDEIKAAAYTPFYIGIQALSPEQKKQLTEAVKPTRDNDTLLGDYFTRYFGINQKVLNNCDIFDVTFGSKGIKRRMKPFFSLDDKDHINDDEALSACIRLTAYLKGTELKYAQKIKQTVKKSLNCYLNEVFLDYLSGVESHPVISEMHNEIITGMLSEVRKCCDIGFVMKCRDANDRIDAAINSVFPLHTVSDDVTVYVRRMMQASAVPHIAELINDNKGAGFGKYTVFEEFYMFLMSLQKRAQLAAKTDRTVFDGMTELFCDIHSRLQAVNLNRIEVSITKSDEEYADLLNIKRDPLQTFQADPVTEYTADFLMVRAPEKSIDFGDFLQMYTRYFVEFMCDIDDYASQKKLFRKIKENLPSLIYIINSICGKTANALDVFLCFYIYFTSRSIKLRQTGHHAYDTKTLFSTINKRELSPADLTALRMTLRRLRKVALVGNYVDDSSEHPAEEMIYDFFSEQLKTGDLIAASENIASLMEAVKKYQST